MFSNKVRISTIDVATPVANATSDACNNNSSGRKSGSSPQVTSNSTSGTKFKTLNNVAYKLTSAIFKTTLEENVPHELEIDMYSLRFKQVVCDLYLCVQREICRDKDLTYYISLLPMLMRSPIECLGEDI